MGQRDHPFVATKILAERHHLDGPPGHAGEEGGGPVQAAEPAQHLRPPAPRRQKKDA